MSGVGRGAGRALLLLGHLLLGFVLAVVLRVARGSAWYTRPIGLRTVQWWVGRLAWVLGLRLQVHGRPLPGPVLLVANHVSWLDVVAIATLCPARFLAKAQVRAWPVVGALAALAGTRFIEREAKSALTRSIELLAADLYAGRRVAVFPEGTTTSGVQVGTFRPALFEAALSSGRPVQAVALSYRRGPGGDAVAPFVGDDSFAAHLWRVLRAPEVEVRISFCPPLAPRTSRRLLAAQAQQQISQLLPTDSLAEAASPAPRVLGEALPTEQAGCSLPA